MRKQDADSIRLIWNGADNAAHGIAATQCTNDFRKRQEDSDGTEPNPCELEPEPTSTLTPSPTTPTLEPTPEPTPPAPPAAKAECKNLAQGIGAGRWEVKGGGWGNDGGAKLSKDLGATEFVFTVGGTDGLEWSATFVSGKSVSDIESAINSNAGGGVAVTCTI